MTKFKKVLLGFIREICKDILLGIIIAVTTAMLLNKDGAIDSKFDFLIPILIVILVLGYFLAYYFENKKDFLKFS